MKPINCFIEVDVYPVECVAHSTGTKPILLESHSNFNPPPTFGGYTGYGYLAVAAALGLLWLYMIWSGFRTANDKLWARRLYVFSFTSMSVLSIMMAIDYTPSFPGISL
jgi:heme O synthase-like polyprenyltransferase